MRRLTLDIETSPNVAHVWALWQQNVSLSQLQSSTQVIAFAAKWYGEKKVEFRSDFHDGHETLVNRAYDLMDEADAIIHYNGNSFDIPHLKREFVEAGFVPPSPHKDIDLCRVVKRQFRFPSNKLDYVSRALGLAGKVSHTGHDLWVRCLNGDEDAWKLMRKYNIGDVRLTEELYERLLPWIPNHPHFGLYAEGDETETDACQNCGSSNLTRQGYSLTQLGKYQRFQCGDCGTWSRGKKAVGTVDVRGVK